MRQLGVPLPELSPVETDVEKSSEILPHERFAVEEREAVEVHRIERNPLEAGSAEKPLESEPAQGARETVAADAVPIPLPDERFAVEEREPVQVYRIERKPMERNPIAAEPAERRQAAVETPPVPLPEPASSLPNPKPLPNRRPPEEERSLAAPPIGRWEEFHEPRHAEPGHGSGAHLQLVPLRPGPSSTLLTADLEREHRSSFLTLAVPGIAALLAVGAVLWSGSLRYRVRQQDAAMSTLQEQNQKLAELMTQMSEEQKTSSAPGSIADAPPSPAAAPQPATGRLEKRQPLKQQPEKRQGVAAPPPVQQKGSQYRRPVEAERAPEIVPPYPTLFKTGTTAANAANSQPVPNAGAYHPAFTPGANQQPVPVAGSNHAVDRPTTSAGTAPRTSVLQASTVPRSPAPQPANASAPAAAPESASQYTPTGNGAYVSPLAQNIEAVEGLQRHSPVQLREFHARAGASTQATPNVRLSVQPEQGRGSYALVVNGGGSSYQLHGTVNQPLAFTDTATHREYALVVLSIADQQLYGYVRAKQ